MIGTSIIKQLEFVSSYSKGNTHCTKNEVFHLGLILSSVNVTKFVVYCGFGHVNYKNP